MDDKTKRSGFEHRMVSLKEDYQARYWTQAFGVTRAELTEAIRNSGRSAGSVRAYLARHR